MRDTRREKNYFDAAIQDVDADLAEYWIDIQNPDGLNPPGRMGVSSGLVRLTLDRLQFCYSRGDKLINSNQGLLNLLMFREMQRQYADALSAEDAYRKVNAERLGFGLYRSYFIWLAFAVNSNFDRDYFNKVLALMDNPGVDALFDRIAIKLGDVDRSLAAKVLYPKPYALLFDALDAAPDRQGQLLSEFLDAWYPACVKQGFFDTHEITDTFAYRGYWCFEAALIVKLFNIDDSDFRNHSHYPAALVHGD